MNAMQGTAMLTGGGWRTTAARVGLEMQCYTPTTDQVLDTFLP